MRILKAFLRDTSGATAIEYGLIATLVSVAAIGGLTALGTKLSSQFNTIGGRLNG